MDSTRDPVTLETLLDIYTMGEDVMAPAGSSRDDFTGAPVLTEVDGMQSTAIDGDVSRNRTRLRILQSHKSVDDVGNHTEVNAPTVWDILHLLKSRYGILWGMTIMSLMANPPLYRILNTPNLST